MADRSGAALGISILSILVSIVVAGLTVGVSLGVGQTTISVNSNVGCTNYQAWVIDRIRDGMSDDAIVELAVGGAQEGGPLHIGFPPPSATTTPSGASSSGAAPTASSVAVTSAPATTFFYTPCQFKQRDEVLDLVRELRSALPTSSAVVTS